MNLHFLILTEENRYNGDFQKYIQSDSCLKRRPSVPMNMNSNSKQTNEREEEEETKLQKKTSQIKAHIRKIQHHMKTIDRFHPYTNSNKFKSERKRTIIKSLKLSDQIVCELIRHSLPLYLLPLDLGFDKRNDQRTQPYNLHGERDRNVYFYFYFTM